MSRVDPSTSLLTTLNTKQQLLENTVTNINNANAPGNLRIDQQASSQGDMGILPGKKTIYTDEGLTRYLRKSNGEQAYWQTINSTYTEFMNQFGTKESPRSLDKVCQGIINNFNNLTINNTPENREAFVRDLNDKLAQFSQIQQSIFNLRTDVDRRKEELVNGENGINDLLNQISQLNGADRGAQDEIDLNNALFNLSQKINITTELGRGIETGFFSVKIGDFDGTSYQKLTERAFVQQLSYTATANPSPGTALNNITLNGINIENQISTGELAGLIKADSNLQKIQASLDNFAKNLRNTLNEIHNLGTSLSPSNTLTGSVGMFGSEGTAIAGTEVISGQGTVRIALINPTNNSLVDYKDIGLQANETINAFITRVNTAGYTLNTGSTFTLSLTAQGQLQVAANNGAQSISIGSVGNTAKVSAGAAYNGAQSTNFSHFFHLNDLLSITSTNTTGLFGAMSVNSNVANNTNKLSGCKLISDAGPLTAASVVLVQRPAPGDNIFKALSDAFSSQQSFSAAGDFAGRWTSLLDYAQTFTEFYGTQKQQAGVSLKNATALLTTRQKSFHSISGVDLQSERLKLTDISRGIRYTLSIMAALSKLEEDQRRILQQTIGN